MSYPDPEIVKSDGLLRLKWEEERERASCSRSALLWYGGYGLSQPGTGSCIIKICFGARAFGVSKDTGSVL